MRHFLLFLLVPCALCEVKQPHLVPPVILVPGDGGSQLQAKLDKPSIVHYICTRTTNYWFDLWLNMELLVPGIIDCWVDNMRLVYDNVTRTTKNSPGVQTRVPGFGTTDTVEWLDPSHRYPTSYFADIVSAMISLGYERNVTVRGAPFDFRKAPNEQQEYFKNLQQLTEEMYEASGHRRVVYLLHSMGGPMMWYFLAHQPQQWKDKYMEAVISMAGAWGGSVKALKVYTAGDNLGIYLISPLKVRAEQRAATSLSFLLPSPDLWKAGDVLVQTPSVNYTTANFKELFEALNLHNAYNMYLDTKDLLRGLRAPGVELHCLYGEGVETVEKLVYAEGKFPDSPELVFGDGDGTVNILSAKVCESFSGQQKQKVNTKAYKGLEHMSILRDKASVAHVIELLSNITKRNEQAAQEEVKRLEIVEKEREANMIQTYATSHSHGAKAASKRKTSSENFWKIQSVDTQWGML